MSWSLFKLPWRGQRRAETERVLVFASRFDGRKPRSAWALLRYGTRVWLVAARSPGCLGAALWAKPLRGKYYTLSAWDSEAALRAFAHDAAHRDGIRALRRLSEIDGVLISWWTDGASWRPRWREAMRRADAATPGPYAGPHAESETRVG
jgi:heme-degrading monooxygenase HmoA